MNETSVATMRTHDFKIVEETANEMSARVFCFHRVDVLVDVQLSLMFSIANRNEYFYSNIF